MKRLFYTLITISILAAIGFGLFRYWPYLFAQTVRGEVVDVRRIEYPLGFMKDGSSKPPSEIFSFAIAIRQNDGEIMTSSSEDRQWAIVKAGQCAEARYFPYPPWNFEKSGTFYNARLIRLSDCESGKFIKKSEQPL